MAEAPSKVEYPPLKAKDTLLVEHVTAAQQDLLPQAKVLMADTTFMLGVLACLGFCVHAGPFLFIEKSGGRSDKTMPLS